MPQQLISVDEAVAMLQTIGAAKETIRRFTQQANDVLGKRPTLGNETVHVSSLYGAKSGEPGVNLEVGELRFQMDVKSAHKIGLDIISAAEAAISDASIMKLLTDKFDLEPEQAGRVLLDLREIRQGSRESVIGH